MHQSPDQRTSRNCRVKWSWRCTEWKYLHRKLRAMSTVDITTKIANLLPTGTFLTFQVIAPLATNNGNCGLTEKVLTACTLAMLSIGCILTCFSDSYTAKNGKTYTGLVTYRGLWVPVEKAETDASEGADGSHSDSEGHDDGVEKSFNGKNARRDTKLKKNYVNLPQFTPQPSDYVNAVLTVTAFLTLTMFTTPVSTCFYPHISDSLLKTLPLLMATAVSFFCTFSPKVRHGIGYALPKAKSPDTSSATNNGICLSTRAQFTETETVRETV